MFISPETKEKKKKLCFCNGFFFEEQVKQRIQEKKRKQLENTKKVKETNLNTTIFQT